MRVDSEADGELDLLVMERAPGCASTAAELNHKLSLRFNPSAPRAKPERGLRVGGASTLSSVIVSWYSAESA